MEFNFSGSMVEAFVFDDIDSYEFICHLYKLIIRITDETSSIVTSIVNITSLNYDN